VQDYKSVTAQHKNYPSRAFDDRQGRELFRVLTEPYQPHPILPNWGGTLTQGVQNSVP